MPTPRDHKRVVREAFTKQAPAYAAAPVIADPERVARLVKAVGPHPEARVLEVATGPGHVALGFAAVCREVVGLDLTPAQLAIAERLRQERGVDNVRFQIGDAEQLPFDDQHFDVVVCRLAFHHFQNPLRVLREMARVCRLGGTIAVEDLVVSEHAERGAFQNRFERLRDPSHVRAYPLSGLLALFKSAGLEVEHVYTDALLQELERWLATSQTPPDRAALVRAMLERDAAEDLSGVRPFVQDGSLHFRQRTAAVIGRRLAAPR
ncbi:MAG TPA: methyltransferase domain-containing protein [Chloroflexota bacterium]